MRNPSAKYKLTEVEKATVKEELRAVLIDLARNREIATYTDVCNRLHSVQLHPHSFIFAHLLREVCNEEEKRGHGILCALVVSKSTGIPSAGYFAGAALRGVDTDDLVVTWQADVESVFALWGEQA
jgi:hypothetical protein